MNLDYPNHDQLTLADYMIPEESKRLDPQLQMADKRFKSTNIEESLIAELADIGIMPIRPYYRMLYLKHAYNWNTETVLTEVSRNLMLKSFCRIPIQQYLPSYEAIAGLNSRYESTVFEIFDS